jgi:hypothetical protein
MLTALPQNSILNNKSMFSIINLSLDATKMYASQDALGVVFQDQKISISTDHLPLMTNKLLGMNIGIYLVVRAVSVSC